MRVCLNDKGFGPPVDVGTVHSEPLLNVATHERTNLQRGVLQKTSILNISNVKKAQGYMAFAKFVSRLLKGMRYQIKDPLATVRYRRNNAVLVYFR